MTVPIVNCDTIFTYERCIRFTIMVVPPNTLLSVHDTFRLNTLSLTGLNVFLSSLATGVP